MPHDYSVVVWAEKSPVQIEANHQHNSETFPNYKMSDNVTLYGLDGEIIGKDTSASEDLGLPVLYKSQDETFEHGYQYKAGQNWIQTDLTAMDEKNLSHVTSISVDGTPFEFKG